MRAFLENPENFPYTLDVEKGMVTFIPLGRSTARTLPFLDYRFIEAPKKLDSVSLASLYQILGRGPGLSPGGKLNFIFHTSFCCSTLLARCLDVKGRNLSLKEPMVILGLAQFKQDLNLKTRNEARWVPLMDMIFQLLARPHDPEERILIKPSNATNNLAGEIFQSRFAGAALFQYSSLERFLISIVDGGQDRQETINGLLPVFLFDHAHNLPIPVQEIPFLSPLKRAALAWVLQMKAFREVLKKNPSENVKSLDCEVFMDRPEKTLSRVSAFFGFALGAAAAEAIVQSPAFLTHSKDPEKPFSLDIWKQRRDRVLKSSGRTIAEAMEFAETLGVSPGEPLPKPLL